jgi:TonB family protein
MAVATGNTLMTEADSVVKAPVAALPAMPPLMDQAPRILKGKAPEYPPRALERGLEASLTVLITIDTLGRVTQVEVEKSGGRDFDPEVARSVRQIVFQPPIRDGKRVTARFRQQYEFRLE